MNIQEPLRPVCWLLGCAGYLGHLFTKSESRASTIALISHLAFTKRYRGQETQEQANQCSMNIHMPNSSTKQRSTMFPSSVEEHGNGDHLVRLIWWRSREHRRVRNPLPDPLMWPSLIVVPDIGLEETVELFLMQDQEMIQACSPDT